MSDKNYNTIDGEIDFKDLILAIWNKKFTIAIITSIFAVFQFFTHFHYQIYINQMHF